MAQYINKDALVAEIENLLDKGKYHDVYDCAYRDGNNGALYALKNKLDALEVKEVDLDIQTFAKEMDSVFALPSCETKNTEEEPLNWEYAIAKHFFELGLKSKSSYVGIPNIDDTLKEMGVDPDSKEADIYREAIYKIYDRLKTQKGEKV